MNPQSKPEYITLRRNVMSISSTRSRRSYAHGARTLARQTAQRGRVGGTLISPNERRAANGYSTLIVPFRPSASRGDRGSRPSRLVTKAYRPGVSEQAVVYRPGGTVTVRR